MFHASKESCSQAESTPAQPPLTQTVSRLPDVDVACRDIQGRERGVLVTAPKAIPLRQRVALMAEAVFMTSFVPKHRVGRVYGLLFKVPLLLRLLRLSFLIPRNVLILTTKGRRTGLPRQTPMEYSPGPEKGVCLVMSGWEGRTDWYRNARADPRVRVWLGGREWDAIAEPVPDGQVAHLMKVVTETSPSSSRIWSRWSQVPIDGSDASYLAAAPHFPALYLCPAKAEAG